MKTKLIPIVQADWIADSVRHFSFCLLRNGKACAVVSTDGEHPESFEASADMRHRRAAVVRLAMRYRDRSIPQQIRSAP